MTALKIMEVALRHFARSGYEGASLGDISAEVGIKKPSIYNHFKGKDELFLAVYRHAAERELRFVVEDLQRDGPMSLEGRLLGLLERYKERYEKEDDTKFFLRTSFFPPAHLNADIVSWGSLHIDKMAEQVQAVFRSAAERSLLHPDVTIQQATDAYMAVLDGFFVEMLYGNEARAKQRLEASWHVFWRGINNNDS
jgi:AcrR family transcriptional regulator